MSERHTIHLLAYLTMGFAVFFAWLGSADAKIAMLVTCAIVMRCTVSVLKALGK